MSIEAVYRLSGPLDKPFLENVQDILAAMTCLKTRLDQQTPWRLAPPAGAISRSGSTLHLYYHQCIMLATRPLLFYLVQRRLTTENARCKDRELSATVKALIATCLDAAASSLSIVAKLHEHDLLGLCCLSCSMLQC